MATDHDAPTRRIVIRAALLLLPLVAGAVLLPEVLPRYLGARKAQRERRPEGPTVAEIEADARARRDLAKAERGWQGARVIVPREARVDASGDKTLPFQGFGLSVTTFPEGARVVVDGQDLGEAPLVASVDCEPGAPVEVALEKPPLPTQRRTTTCRADTLVELSVRLEP